MKFHKVSDRKSLEPEWGNLGSAGPDVTVWANDNNKCLISLYDGYVTPSYSGHAQVTVHFSWPSIGTDSVTCERDGVAAFVIKEVMEMAERHDWDKEASVFRARIDQFMSSLPVKSNRRIKLADFHAYKNGFRGWV